MTLRLDKDRPAGFKPTQGVVQATRDRNEFSEHGAIEVWPAKFGGALERAVFVENDSLADKRCPRQEIR